ncbi:zinc finger protein 578-like [Uranotaenia lowii]|uniref:zinc finger protein 578-like n=1 Tax=Uranotaenia lowii TaxID=190385 RepID=UPI002478C998|nr:zinc finger protein 578-like [Uranotaenia lowii]
MSSVENTCRLCMGKSNVIHNVFEENLLQKIAICISILINPEDNTLPLDICALCALKVKDFFEFRMNCQKVQQLLEQNRMQYVQVSAQIIHSNEVFQNFGKLEPLVTEIEQPAVLVPIQAPQTNKLADLVQEVIPELLTANNNLEALEPEQPVQEAVEHLVDVSEEVENDAVNPETSQVLLNIEPLVDEDIEFVNNYESSMNDSKDQDFEIEMILSYDESYQDDTACSTTIDCIQEPKEPVTLSQQENEPKNEIVRKRGRKKSEQKNNQPRDEKLIYQSLLLHCNICAKSVERNRMEGHLNKHQNLRPYTCTEPDCGFSFHSKISLRLHRNAKHATDHLPCDLCGKVYNSKKALYHHKNESHSNKRYDCDQCDLVFVTKSRLNRHKITHTELRDFKCPHCPKEFYRSNNLKVHLRSHSKEKPYACEICNKAFGYPRLLKEHITKLHLYDVVSDS